MIFGAISLTIHEGLNTYSKITCNKEQDGLDGHY